MLRAVFGGVEEAFRQVNGVDNTTVGYTGGNIENPTYQDVWRGTTGHAEAVLIEYTPFTVTCNELQTPNILTLAPY